MSRLTRLSPSLHSLALVSGTVEASKINYIVLLVELLCFVTSLELGGSRLHSVGLELLGVVWKLELDSLLLG